MWLVICIKLLQSYGERYQRMYIDDLKIEDIKDKKVYKFIDEESSKIEEYGGEIKENTGYYLISGMVLLNDETELPAFFGIDSDDSGEMYEYYFFTPNGWVSSSQTNIESSLGKKIDDIFPFKYHLNREVEGDIHIGDQY